MPLTLKSRQQAAIAAVHGCALAVESQAGALLGALPGWAIDDAPRASVVDLCEQLTDASRRVQFELALLQQQLADGQETADGALQRLTQLEATLMDGLAGLADVVDGLEAAAEADERKEAAFTGAMEALASMLRVFKDAKAATEALRGGTR